LRNNCARLADGRKRKIENGTAEGGRGILAAGGIAPKREKIKPDFSNFACMKEGV